MAFQFTSTTNLAPSTATQAIYNLIVTALCNNGAWILEGYSDGSTFNNTGPFTASSAFTSAGSGAHGLGNTNSWARLRTPTGTRELLFQRGASDLLWWIQYSQSAGFTGGSPSATVAPTATDAKNLNGTSSAGLTCFGTNNTYHQQIAVDSAGTTSSGYGWYMLCYPNAGGEAVNLFMFDPVTANSDPDPYVLMMGSINNGTTAHLTPTLGGTSEAANSTISMGITSTTDKGVSCAYIGAVSSGNFVTVSPALYYCQSASANVSIVIPGNLGVDPNTSNDNLFPVFWVRPGNNFSVTTLTSPVGYKGLSSLCLWTGSIRGNNYDTITVSSSGDHIIVNGSMALPWNGSTPN